MNAQQLCALYEKHGATVYRVAYSFLKNRQDTEDVVQETFLRLLQRDILFCDENHEKAWLIVTASNLCKNVLRHWFRGHGDIDECDIPADTQDDEERREVIRAVLNLSDKYKTIVYLYYYEGYTGDEIARMLHMPPASVRTRLRRARELLKSEMEGVWDDHTGKNQASV